MDRRSCCLAFPLLAAPAVSQTRLRAPAPDEVQEAVVLLRAFGMPDIRGLTWHEVTYGKSGGFSGWRGYGWVLPGLPRRIVTAFGALRAVEAVGPRVGLAVQIDEALKQDEQRRLDGKKESGQDSFLHSVVPWIDVFFVSAVPSPIRDPLLHPATICLLDDPMPESLRAVAWASLEPTAPYGDYCVLALSRNRSGPGTLALGLPPLSGTATPAVL